MLRKYSSFISQALTGHMTAKKGCYYFLDFFYIMYIYDNFCFIKFALNYRKLVNADVCVCVCV